MRKHEGDGANDPHLESWVESANDPLSDFPVQNLPFGRYRCGGSDWRVGVAIGDQVLDLHATGVPCATNINALMALPPAERKEVREHLSLGLRRGSSGRARFETALRPITEVELGVPCEIRDYSDFYVGIHHATAIGKQFRPDQPLLPN